MSRETPHFVNRDEQSASQTSRLARGFRAVLWVLIVAASFYVACVYGRLWVEWRQATQPSEALASSGFDPDMLAPELPLDGPWSFARLDWSIRTHFVSRDDIDARFEALATSLGGAGDVRLPDVSSELIQFAENLRLQPVERNGNQVYRFERNNLIAQLVARIVEGKPKVVAAAAALPANGDEWQFLEFTPTATKSEFSPRDEHLLPLPSGARRDGGRFADDGRPLLELISLNTNADELFSTWKNAGWEVRSAEMDDTNDFRYLCARGDEVVYAWSADPRDSLRNLMLVHTPTSSDTGKSE
jgi:hypothetical protein